nr:hypothetical protein Q903MT_gene1761 [Picea sitchensis]
MKRKARHSSLPLLPTNMFSATLASQSYFHCTHLSFISRLLKLNSHLLIERPYPEQNPYRLKDHHSPYLFVHPGGDEKKIKMTN